MADAFKLPELGENVEAGTVTKVMIDVGDHVEVDQPVLEIETDKAVLEVPSGVAGEVSKLLAKEGAEIRVGDPVFEYNANGESSESKDDAGEKDEKPKKSKAKSKAKAKDDAEDDENGEPEEEDDEKSKASSKKSKAKKQDADEDDSDEDEGDDADEADADADDADEGDADDEEDEAPSKKSKAKKRDADEDDEEDEAPPKKSKTKKRDADEDDSDEDEGDDADEDDADADDSDKGGKQESKREEGKRPPRRSGGPVPAAPSVRGFAREIGIDINDVTGSGPGGRISLQDVKDHARGVNTDVRGQAPAQAAPSSPAAVNLPDFSRWGEVEYETMSGVRRRTAENMTLAWTTIPQVTQFDKVDVTELDKLRKQFSKQVEAAGGKLTMTAIIVKVVAAALKKFPQFNASVDMANNEIIYKKYYNIGVAVDTDRGLLVPVVRDVDQKNLTELSIEITELAERARDRKTKLEEMQGGTFTVSNLGGIGGTGFSPIVNAPEAAILGIARTHVEPVFVDGNFRPSSMLPLSLTYDHRVIDGADGARFLRWVCEALQQPFLLFLEG